MATVIGVRFRNAGKLYYFDPGAMWPAAGDAVIVETVRGIEYGEVVTGVSEIADELITPPLKRVIRIATPEDAQHEQDNRAKESDALAVCQKKVEEHKLQMKLVSCEYTFDNSKILFYFVSDKRVDFRALVKDLAGIFRTRIELRQIGVRDEAKMLGGLGLCGRPLCCASFLGDFQPVSIKMAKEQSLSLNPTKISGVCGRLMCCLKYEEDAYEATRKRMPRVGKEVQTPDGVGIVIDLNILKETVRVRIPKGDGTEQKDYPLTDVQRLAPAAPHRAPAEADAENLPAAENAPSDAAEETAPDADDSTAVTDDVPADEEMTEELANEEGVDPQTAKAEVEELIESDDSAEIPADEEIPSAQESDASPDAQPEEDEQAKESAAPAEQTDDTASEDVSSSTEAPEEPADEPDQPASPETPDSEAPAEPIDDSPSETEQ